MKFGIRKAEFGIKIVVSNLCVRHRDMTANHSYNSEFLIPHSEFNRGFND